MKSRNASVTVIVIILYAPLMFFQAILFIYSFTVYLTTLLVVRAEKGQMIGWLMNTELKRML
jgi:hypothetical protein